MTFGEAARSLLMADATVVSLVKGRVYPGAMPQDNRFFPAIRYTVIDDLPVNSLAGFTSGLRNARVQIDCFARTYLDAQALADAVVGALGAVKTTEIASALESRRDLYEDATQLHDVSIDFSMWGG